MKTNPVYQMTMSQLINEHIRLKKLLTYISSEESHELFNVMERNRWSKVLMNKLSTVGYCINRIQETQV
jgi:predicted nucleic acid-binding protein